MWEQRWMQRAQQRLDKGGLPLRVKFWNGCEYLPRVPERLALSLNVPSALRVLAAPTLGRLAQAYVEDEFDVEGDIRDVLAISEQLCEAARAADRRSFSFLSWLRHSRPADRKNIGYHYDVSNEFFALWLDARRVYS